MRADNKRGQKRIFDADRHRRGLLVFEAPTSDCTQSTMWRLLMRTSAITSTIEPERVGGRLQVFKASPLRRPDYLFFSLSLIHLSGSAFLYFTPLLRARTIIIAKRGKNTIPQDVMAIITEQ